MSDKGRHFDLSQITPAIMPEAFEGAHAETSTLLKILDWLDGRRASTNIVPLYDIIRDGLPEEFKDKAKPHPQGHIPASW